MVVFTPIANNIFYRCTDGIRAATSVPSTQEQIVKAMLNCSSAHPDARRQICIRINNGKPTRQMRGRKYVYLR